MYLYKQRYRKPCFNLLTDLKKQVRSAPRSVRSSSPQYRNAAIAKPIHFEPLMATPVIKDLHPGQFLVGAETVLTSCRRPSENQEPHLP